MPDLDRSYQPPTQSISRTAAGPAFNLHSNFAGVQQNLHHVGNHNSAARTTPAYRSTLSPINTNTIYNTVATRNTSSPSSQTRTYEKAAVHCIKPLPSVPQDVDAEDDSSELVHLPRPSLQSDLIESDISSASASTASTSSSMETSDWQETSLRNQVNKLHIDYTDVDLAQTETPSVFGLRRRIVAAALDHVSSQSSSSESGNGGLRHFEEAGLSEWLSAQPSSSGQQWKEKILRKKLSFGNKKSRSTPTVHDPMPNDATSPADSSNRSRASSIAGSTSSHDKMLKRDKELAERESNFDLVVLSRFETAELKMMVYTESRQGSWVVKGPADPHSRILDEPPVVFSPWDCQIDSRAIVERKKLRSFVELSDTTCCIRCTTCSSPHHKRLGKGYEVHRKNLINRRGDGVVSCTHCNGSGAVTATYVVCVTLRQTSFLPLTMPARHRSGKHQDAFRSYLPKTTKAMSHIDLLRMRSLEAVRSCALRVGRVHHKEHDARLLMAKAVLERRNCNSVTVINRANGVFRVFDITDGGLVRGRMVEEESRIVETPELGRALGQLPITAVVTPEGCWRFVDLELVDMASSKQLSFVVEESRSPSIYTAGSSTDDSYSPSAFSFFQRATGGQNQSQYGGDTSRDSQTLRGSKDQHPSSQPRSLAREQVGEEAELPPSDSRHRWQLPPLNINPTSATSLSSCSPSSSLLSFASARDSPNSGGLSVPRKPWISGGGGVRSAPGSPSAQTSSNWSGYTTARGSSSYLSEKDASRDSVRSGSSRSSGTMRERGNAADIGASPS